MAAKLSKTFLSQIGSRVPDAIAQMIGSPVYPDIQGTISFWKTDDGVLVASDVNGLPYRPDFPCDPNIFAIHIHEGESCSSITDFENPFLGAFGHYNPTICPHPAHAGDLPPLFSNEGSAWGAVLTDRFTVEDIIGQAVIIHRDRDDFTSQPGGNAGPRIACGLIEPTN